MLLRAAAPLTTGLLLLLHSSTSSAKPFTLNTTDLVDSQNGTISKRCDKSCGYYGQICCGADEVCYTDSSNQAQCGSGSNGAVASAAVASGSGSGYWQYYTSVYTETDTVIKTQVYSSFIGSTPAAVVASSTYCPPSAVVTPAVGASPTAVAITCNWSGGESSCGNICCSSGQYCQVSGQCSPSSSSASVSAALRPTSSGMSVVTQQSVSTTTTEPFTPPIATGQNLPVTQTSANTSSGGLSGGAIAGIVIGVLLALVILTLLLLCLCFKAAWDAIVALFGGKKRNNRRRETVEYESYHRSGRGDGRSRTWYGGAANRPGRVERTTTTTTKKGAAAGGLGGLAVAMGLKRKDDRNKRRRRDEKSEYSESSYDSYSGYSDPSELPLRRGI